MVTTRAVDGSPESVVPNRILPQFVAPNTTLEFPAQPTPADFLRKRVLEEPLVPIGGEPDADENAALAAALLGYAHRNGPDDFSTLMDFLQRHPRSPWAAALLTNLGLEYYNTAHYSKALDAWTRAWTYAKDAHDAKSSAVVNRAVSELAFLYARLGRMEELESLLTSVEGRLFLGGETEKMTGAREALWMMKNRPDISFRCGPLALQSIRHTLDPRASADAAILDSASTVKGFSLAEVAELSKKLGDNYQMAFREKNGAVIVPSVVHWKVGHYAAIVRQEGDRYLVEDPTFRNSVWPTKQTLEEESSGYFLIPPGGLPPGWRKVDAQEAAQVWGKGVTSANDADNHSCKDVQTATCGSPNCPGMAGSSVHLMLANLQLRDTPVGYTPPFGPPVQFTVRYNHRDTLPEGFTIVYGVLGVKWTHDWISWIADQPQSPLADVKYYAGGGGARTFTGFDASSKTYAFQQYDQTQLRRTGTNSYEMVLPDGSKKVFTQPDDSSGTTRRVYLTQVIDPSGNAATLSYDGKFNLVAITDALGQVTTISYDGAPQPGMITKVTDPFGRFATFEYTSTGNASNTVIVLSKITDVLGLTSQFVYSSNGVVNQLITPYGTTGFTVGEGPSQNSTMRFVEMLYPDGSRERVEFNQSPNLGMPTSEPSASVPQGMNTYNTYLYARNTYYWSRKACAEAYGDYSKAKIYHWLHTVDLTTTSGVLESTKEPLEGRVWYNYAGQPAPYAIGPNNRPWHVGRVLDDGTTQLYTRTYNDQGNVIQTIDPVGRTFTMIYDTNGIDLLQVVQTRSGNQEVMSKRTYNSQHKPLTVKDAAGQTTILTYNNRGQILTKTNPKNETIKYNYDNSGYLIGVDGPLPGPDDKVTATHDSLGRLRTMTDVSGYTLKFDYDNMDRLQRVTHPDGTYREYTFDRLNLASIRDRAGRMTYFENNNMRQMIKMTDPLNRVTLLEWCRCGALSSLTDALGRQTLWFTDIQGRPIAKEYSDGSQVKYLYEKASGRKIQMIDEKQQISQFSYNLDNTVKSVTYINTAIPTPGVSFTYDTNYSRISSMTDGTGSTIYSYIPVTGSPAPGAGRLGSVDGPLTDDTLTYGYDELGRLTQSALDGAEAVMTLDALGRHVSIMNALGAFAYAYDGNSERLITKSFPNGQVEEYAYGGVQQDQSVQRITHRFGNSLISEFLYDRDVPAGHITTWSDQSGSQSPSIWNFTYDAVNQLLSTTVTNSGTLINQFAFSYDLVGNRLTESLGNTNYSTAYNALNQVSLTSAQRISRSYEWDGANRLVSVTAGNQRTEFAYDGLSRMVGIRQLVNGIETSHRLFVWDHNIIREERDAQGAVTKRFFPQGMKIETGASAGSYYYVRDHRGSVRKLIDATGNLRASYDYDSFGRRTKLSGDLDTDFGFAGMFWAAEVGLSMARFRTYDAESGRWLSRDPLKNAEVKEGSNLYAYVQNEPVNRVDPLGLGISTLDAWCEEHPVQCAQLATEVAGGAAVATVAEESTPGWEALGENAVACVDNVVSQVENGLQNIGTLPGIGPDTVSEFSQTAPQVSQEIVEEGEEVVMHGQEFEDWLLSEGEVGGDRFGPNALAAMRESSALEQEFMEANRDMPFAMRAQLAHEYAVGILGFDVASWLK